MRNGAGGQDAAREMAAQGIEQAREACERMIDLAGQSAEMWWGAMPASPVTNVLKSMHGSAIELSRSNTSAAFTYANELAKVRDVGSLLQLQTEFMQSRMRAFADQAQEMSRIAMSSTPRR